jgi:osmotically-inducible protein OsmY
MTDDELGLDVATELFWDPKVNAGQVAVSAEDGTATLRGTVGSFRQKREAVTAAQRLYGVIEVNDELQVRIPDAARREDAEVRGDVPQALMLDSIVPVSVDAKVEDGFVTLTGTVSWQYQRDEAEFIAGNVPGVRGVEDGTILIPVLVASDVAKRIAAAFGRNAILAAGDLSVSTICFGMVTVSGAVRSWAERDNAIAAAWAAPGVTEVVDRIVVEY